MTSRIEIKIEDQRLVLGVQDVEVLIDGKSAGSMQLGDAGAFETPSGTRRVQLVLHALIDRQSPELAVDLGEGETARLQGRYSRVTGDISLSGRRSDSHTRD